MRESVPAPILSAYAVVSLTASTSRKSRRSAATAVGLTSFVHVVPPSSVRRIVFPAPLAHATRSETALTPRNRTVTPDDCGVHDGARRNTARPAATPQLTP